MNGGLAVLWTLLAFVGGLTVLVGGDWLCVPPLLLGLSVAACAGKFFK